MLANVRAAGKPIFEFDFLPGSDIIGEIASDPRAGGRMEFELLVAWLCGEGFLQQLYKSLLMLD